MGMRMASLSLRWAEMMHASVFVMNHRAQLMLSAAENPENANLDELGRMIPEKADAFYRGFASMGKATDPVDALERFMKPVHKRAVANARRLRRTA